MLRKSIPLVSPDFDSLRDSLKTYLSQQSEFNDYNFEGSTLAVLLDLLSYNSHYNVFYLNQLFNESFLSTAVTRNAAVKRAQALNYIPKSKTSATAVISVSISNLTGSKFVIPEGTGFFSTVGNNSFEFYTTQEYSAAVVNGIASFPVVEIVEGRRYTYKYPASPTNLYQIPTKDADISRLRVYQISPDNSTETEFLPALNITELSSSDTRFFIQEGSDGRFEVYFGDGLIGAAVTEGTVKLQYNISSGSLGNEVGVFTGSTLSGSVTITTVEVSSGGSDADSIEAIKLKAPQTYQAQNRAVTAQDYASLLRDNFNFIDNLVVLPGDTLKPPVYGKVFIKIKPTGGLFISATQTSNIIKFLKQKRVATITPEIQDSSYLFVDINTAITYNAATTTDQKNIIQANVKSVIQQFQQELTKANTLYLAQLTANILEVSTSIIDSEIGVTMRLALELGLGALTTYTFNFNQPIVPGSGTSNTFRLSGTSSDSYLQDTGTGKIQLVLNSIKTDVGTIDYQTGKVTITLTTIDISDYRATEYSDITTGYLHFKATPVEPRVIGVTDVCLIDQVEVM